MYLAKNRLAGGPRPTRHESPFGTWWSISERQHQRCELAAMFGLAVNPTGQLDGLSSVELGQSSSELLAAAEAEAEPP